MGSLKNRFVFFVDDIINGHRQHALQLFRALRGKGLKWAAQATVMITRDEELLDAAVEAGCHGLFIGFEIFSSPNLKKLGKPDNWRERFFQICSPLHRKKGGDLGRVRFRVGHRHGGGAARDGQTGRGRTRIRTILEVDPLPGTAQWKQFVAEHRIVEDDWSKFNFQNTVYRPKLMNADELDRVVRDAWREFYRPSKVAKRLIRHWLPLTKGNLVVWALNLGITRVIRQYKRYEDSVCDTSHPLSVFEQMQQQGSSD